MISPGIFENLGVIDLPFNLDIAKKSLTSTISALYAMMLIGNLGFPKLSIQPLIYQECGSHRCFPSLKSEEL